MAKTNKIENLAYTYIKEQITNKHWFEGMQIKELVVAEELGISRTPVRKAFKRLEEDKLLYIKPNKGVYVSKQHLGLKEQKERIYFLEAILQHILYTLQLDEVKVSEKCLKNNLNAMKINLRETTDAFERNEIDFWHTIIEYHSNDYMNQTVIQTLTSLYEKSETAVSILDKSRPIKLTHYTNLVDYISKNNYTYARREVRILLNQLLINLIQGVD